jgi:hypothetical protein
MADQPAPAPTTPTSPGPPEAPKPDAAKPQPEPGSKPPKEPRSWPAGLVFIILLVLVAIAGGYFLWIKG